MTLAGPLESNYTRRCRHLILILLLLLLRSCFVLLSLDN